MRVVILTGMFVLFAGTIAMVHADGDDGQRSDVPECVQYWGEARYGAYGYDHVVHVANGCDEDARCRVASNVNPDWQRVTVPADAKKEVVTYVGSPAREFTPYVQCELK
ncbi:MAG: hypothetical protein ACOCV4_08220 [Myxococcota bacterium]